MYNIYIYIYICTVYITVYTIHTIQYGGIASPRFHPCPYCPIQVPPVPFVLCISVYLCIFSSLPLFLILPIPPLSPVLATPLQVGPHGSFRLRQ